MLVFTGVVTAWVGANSELEDRRENASDVVGKASNASSTNTEPYESVFILPSGWKVVLAKFPTQTSAMIRPSRRYLILF